MSNRKFSESDLYNAGQLTTLQFPGVDPGWMLFALFVATLQNSWRTTANGPLIWHPGRAVAGFRSRPPHDCRHAAQRAAIDDL
ncbi:hypothetical protein PWR63_13330 [Paraburkholderia sp. A2WS-5]|uniref:hypothetical protein n=1 Tax=unclassified Paraburkholderia TaxID=2615204 RepID=UPI003B7A48BB